MSASAPSTSSLIEAAQAANKGSGGLPPVEKWDPPFCGDMDLFIARDGNWIHERTPIGRPALVRLFSTILRKDGDEYFLVTPVEKLRIQVEDAPFIAVDMERVDAGLRFTSNVGDQVIAGPDAPIRVEFSTDGTPSPYVTIRRNLEAKIDRKTFYRMIELAETEIYDGVRTLGIRSAEVFFPVMSMTELEANT